MPLYVGVRWPGSSETLRGKPNRGSRTDHSMVRRHQSRDEDPRTRHSGLVVESLHSFSIRFLLVRYTMFSFLPPTPRKRDPSTTDLSSVPKFVSDIGVSRVGRGTESKRTGPSEPK